ncbi:hypothetical protein B488_07650 [Liberibacter crescens BT-1]|uniref:Uncharacterized protein n=1 Tax=Liberibacter crescens (strain BT-1) TaxID=1215343 RepID=L0EUW9_LIBCB|nr:hypothetical protein B488_07650 [Liberibacter crescens BT-1]
MNRDGIDIVIINKLGRSEDAFGKIIVKPMNKNKEISFLLMKMPKFHI